MKNLWGMLGLVLLMGCPNASGTFVPDQWNPGVTYENLNPIAPITGSNQSLGDTNLDWYKDAVFYHLWIPAFRDGMARISTSEPNGEGDIQGIRDKISYLTDLGVTAVWLSPFWASSSSGSNRHNYDATNHYLVNPNFGSNADLTNLIKDLHNAGIRVIFDWVPNHVSDQHQWFQNSAASLDGKRDWFIWRNSRPAGWTGWDSYSDFHANGSSYYYGIFSSGMPDLNYENQEVRDATGSAIIHWLNQGFDGVRVDAVKYLYEDWRTSGSGKQDQQPTFDHFAQMRTQILDKFSTQLDGSSKPLHKFMVAENWESDRSNLLKYMAEGATKRFHMTLDFPFAYASSSLNMSDLNNHWRWVKDTVEPSGGWMGTFASNHDNVVSRPMTNFGNDAGKVRLQAALQLTGVGTPFIYYGNELGMKGASGNDINLRQPINWTDAAAQQADSASLYAYHKNLINLRKNRASLRTGTYTEVFRDSNIFAYERTLGSERTLVVANLTNSPKSPAITLGTAPSGVSTLFGTHNLTSSGSTVTLNNIPGYGVRVINLSGGGSFTLMNDVAYTPPPVTTVFLRGTLTSWDPGTQMSETSGTYSLTLNLTGSTPYEFKFFSDGSTWLGFNELTYDAALNSGALASTNFVISTSPGSSNVKFTPGTTKSYTFTFRLSDKHYCVK